MRGCSGTIALSWHGGWYPELEPMRDAGRAEGHRDRKGKGRESEGGSTLSLGQGASLEWWGEE